MTGQEQVTTISMADLRQKEAKCGMFLKNKLKDYSLNCVLILECRISFRCQAYFGKRTIATGYTCIQWSKGTNCKTG